MPSASKRKGPGAPKGNLNAFKHGHYSKTHQRLIDALVAVPEARDALLAYDRAQKRKIRRARKIARTLFVRLLQGLPPNPDASVNQQVKDLLKASAAPSKTTPLTLSPSKGAAT